MAGNPDDSTGNFGAPLRLLLVAACVVVLIAGLKAASPLIAPFLVAVFVATISLPVLTWLRRRLPVVVAVLGTILMDVLVLAVAAYVIATTVNQLAGQTDEIQATLANLGVDGIAWLEERGLPVDRWLADPVENANGVVSAETGVEAPGDTGTAAREAPARAVDEQALPRAVLALFDVSSLVDVANRTLRTTATVFSSLVIISLIVVFMLFEAATFRPKVRIAFGGAGAEERFDRVMHEIQHYMGIKTVVSLVTGLLIGAWVGILRVDFAVFWGLVAFVLNFIPNLGSIIAAVPTTILALVQIGPGRALLVALGYLAVNMVIGNFIEPPLMGRRLGLSALVVVLSLVFWGWVWGPIGMLLSVPLTMVVKIMLENTEEFRWVAVLLGDSRAVKRLAPASGGGEEE